MAQKKTEEEKKNGETRQKILKAALRLFSQHGYTATSTRMIANEAGVTLSAIAFYFTTKENLYDECMQYATRVIRSYYAKDCTAIQNVLDEGNVTEEKAWECLEKLIHVQLRTSFSTKNTIAKQLVYQEQMSKQGKHEVQRAVYETVESLMARLIMIITHIEKDEAIVVSRHINGGIMSFSEHEGLVVPYLSSDRKGKELNEWMEEIILKDSLAMIARYKK